MDDTAAPGEQPNDEELLRAVRSGDASAFVVLYDRHANAVHDFCFAVLRDREQAADAVHDTFVVAAQVVDRLRPSTRTRSWLFALARQECMDRAAGVRPPAPPAPSEPPPPGGGVWEAVGRLPADQRLVLDLHLRQRLTGDEVGEAIGMLAEDAAALISTLRNDVDRWLDQQDDHEDESGASSLAALAGVLAVPAPVDLRTQVLVDASLAREQRPPRGYRAGFPAPLYGPARRRLLAGVASAVLLVGLVTGLTLAVALGGDDDEPAGDRASVLGVQQTTTSTRATTSTSAPAAVPTTVASTTTTAVTTTTATTTSTAPAPAPRLELVTRSLEFGRDATTGTIRILNQGQRALSWTATPNAGWLATRPAGGTLAAGARGAFTVLVDRSRLVEGPFSASVIVRGGGRRGSVAVHGSVERPPRLSSAGADHTVISVRGCPAPVRAVVSVTLTDESGVGRVTLVASSQEGSRAMRHRGGGRYEGVLGPYDGPGTVTYHIEAADTRGNVSRSTTGSLRVVNC